MIMFCFLVVKIGGGGAPASAPPEVVLVCFQLHVGYRVLFFGSHVLMVNVTDLRWR
jgi:hypothetical protein